MACVSCGQCIVSCPTGALTERDQCDEVLAAINDPEKYVVVQTAPAIRATLGECFGMPVGTNVKGKMVAALRRLGFDKVFDTDFGADLTIMEEATEFLDRVKNGGVLPMIFILTISIDGTLLSYLFTIALNLHFSMQAPHLMHLLVSITCGFFTVPLIAPTGQLRAQSVQPLHLSSRI